MIMLRVILTTIKINIIITVEIDWNAFLFVFGSVKCSVCSGRMRVQLLCEWIALKGRLNESTREKK